MEQLSEAFCNWSIPAQLPKCNGLQWKWLGTAINGVGTTLNATTRNHRLRPVLRRGEAHASLKNALEGLLSRTSLDLGPRVSHHTSNHPIETRQLSLLHCLMRVYLTKTG